MGRLRYDFIAIVIAWKILCNNEARELIEFLNGGEKEILETPAKSIIFKYSNKLVRGLIE